MLGLVLYYTTVGLVRGLRPHLPNGNPGAVATQVTSRLEARMLAGDKSATVTVPYGKAFKELDFDGDGFLNRYELLQLFRDVEEPLTSEELDLRMAEADLDGDGLIDFLEFESLVRRARLPQGDYGFRATGYYGTDVGDPSVPANGFRSAAENFRREFDSIRRAIRYGDGPTLDRETQEPISNPKQAVNAPRPFDVRSSVWEAVRKGLAAVDTQLEASGVFDPIAPALASFPRASTLLLRRELRSLTLSNARVAEREDVRMAQRKTELDAAGGVNSADPRIREEASQLTPWFVLVPYKGLCVFLDVCFEDRPIARFWFLETVARIPYFSYISMLHLFETLGWWRNAPEVRKIHFAQEWNEMHHLLIMEALGGDKRWTDRFLARHAAVLYYWILCAIFFASPALAYNFSELIEAHAVDTYGEFLDANDERLRALPAPPIAKLYYGGSESYSMRGTMSTASADRSRTAEYIEPKSLYDVFQYIIADEGEHVATMRSCQDAEEDVPRYSAQDPKQLGLLTDDLPSELTPDQLEELAALGVSCDNDPSGCATWAVTAADELKRAGVAIPPARQQAVPLTPAEKEP